jgi:hypothetical protein
MSLARQLVERSRHVPYAAIPEGVHDAALPHLCDMIGVRVPRPARDVLIFALRSPQM